MKALKLSAVIFTALLALSACKTAPEGGSSIDAKLQEGLNDALGQIGSVAGMTGYTQQLSDTEGSLASTTLTEIYLNNPANPASYKEASSILYNGTIRFDDGTTLTFDNEVVVKNTTTAGVKKLVEGTDYKPIYTYSESGNQVTLNPNDVDGYIFIELTSPVQKEWGSVNAGGTGQWEDSPSQNPTQRYALKVEGNKLYRVSISVSGVDQSINFDRTDPRSPNSKSTYTKK